MRPRARSSGFRVLPVRGRTPLCSPRLRSTSRISTPLTRVCPDAGPSPRAAASPGGPLRTLSGNALQQRLIFAEGKDAAAACASPAAGCAPAPAQLVTPTAGVAQAHSPASLPAPLTSELPRGARLMRLGLTLPSPPKLAGTRSRRDDDTTRLVVTCTAALFAAVLLGAGVAALRPRRAADMSTALVPFNAAAAADQARRLYPFGQAMLLPFAPPTQLQCQWLALAALGPHVAWSHCGASHAMSASGMPALPSGAEAMQPGELALAAVAAIATAAAITADAYGMLAERASEFMEAHAAGSADAQQHTLAAAGTCLLLVVALALLRVFMRRRRAADADVETSESFDEGEDEAVDDNLVTPQSGIDEEFSYSHSAQGVDSDLAELPEGELRDSWPLVSTPAVTRLLSFSRVASPAGSMRTSIGYGGPAVPASAQQRRSRRLAGRDATVAAVGVPPPTRGSVQRIRGQHR